MTAPPFLRVKLLGCLTVLLALALFFSVFASGSVGWFATWDCNAPCTIGVDYSAMPQSEWPLIEAAMTKWSASPSINYVADFHGARIRLEPCAAGPGCGFLTYPTYSKQNHTLHRVTIEFSDQWFGWDGMPLVYCHELGHALGFLDGAVEPDSCMAGTADHPGVEDYALLEQLYSAGG